ERPRSRPEPELPRHVDADRPAREPAVVGSTAVLRARDAHRAAADHAPPPAADAVVPPAGGARPSVGPEHPGGAALRAARGCAVPRPRLAERHGVELAE